MTLEISSNVIILGYVLIALLGIYLIVKFAKDKTSKVSSLRLFVQIAAVIAIFMGLIIGPFNQPLTLPLGPSPRDNLLGANLLGNQFPDGFSVPVLACYYPNGRTVTCPIWQLQAYIFPFWNYPRGYNVFYSTSGLEKIGVVISMLVVAAIVLGRFFCGWLCPFGLYQDVLTRIRKVVKKRHLTLSEKTNTALAQSRYLIIAVMLILSVIFASYAIFGAQLIPGTSPGGPEGTEAGVSSYINEPFCLVCPMRPLCVLIECLVGSMKLSYVSKIIYGPFGITGGYITSVNIIVLAAITVLAFTYRRFFCRICPLGALTGLFSTFTPFKQISLTRLNKNEQKCTKCGVCKRVCPTQATDVYEKKGGDVTESRCILCARCVELCPYEDALELKIAGKTAMKSRNWLEQGNEKTKFDIADD
ncbi:MAG TPA: 4Fe-4S binding protein [Candidatus Limnocylindrales bacterium]|nr:4Fe-4S binding protein [Candidatus Limnocylindrales bacterium]